MSKALLCFAFLFGQTLFAAAPFSLSRDCAVKEDQLGSFVTVIPQTMHLLVDSRFDKDEQKSIQKAADTWNKIGQNRFGLTFFQVAVTEIPPSVANTHSLDCSANWGGRGSFYLVRVASDAQWKSFDLAGNPDAQIYAPGVTKSCFDPASHELLEEMTLINTNAAMPEQFESIVVHELGHALGLAHSCNAMKTNDPEYVSCDKIPDGHPYHLAVMYPALRKVMPSTSMPEMKQAPAQNDLVRLQCLYGPR